MRIVLAQILGESSLTMRCINIQNAMLNNLLVCRTLLLACTLALVLVFAPATSQSQPSESKCGIASEICYDDVVLKEAVRIAQWGYWTYCWVNLRSGIQIAVVDARTVEQCRQFGKDCARGRPYHGIHFSTNSVLQSSDRIEKCERSWWDQFPLCSETQKVWCRKS